MHSSATSTPTHDESLVVIPLFNEEETIEAVIAEIRAFYPGDILVVDDGSGDRSVAIVKAFADPKIFILSHEKNMGYGRSLIDAFEFAVRRDYKALVTIDGDWQHEPRFIPQFLEELRDADIVSGSRYFFGTSNVPLQGNTAAPADRYQINRTITQEINALTGYELTDTFCGFKAYRVCGLKKLCITEEGYGMPLQFWVQAWAHNLRVKEIPVTRIYRNLNRSFGATLDDPARRLAYYRSIIEKELSHVTESVECTGLLKSKKRASCCGAS